MLDGSGAVAVSVVRGVGDVRRADRKDVAGRDAAACDDDATAAVVGCGGVPELRVGDDGVARRAGGDGHIRWRRDDGRGGIGRAGGEEHAGERCVHVRHDQIGGAVAIEIDGGDGVRLPVRVETGRTVADADRQNRAEGSVAVAGTRAEVAAVRRAAGLVRGDDVDVAVAVEVCERDEDWIRDDAVDLEASARERGVAVVAQHRDAAQPVARGRDDVDVAVVVDVGSREMRGAVRAFNRIGIKNVARRAERAVAGAEEDRGRIAGGDGEIEVMIAIQIDGDDRERRMRVGGDDRGRGEVAGAVAEVKADAVREGVGVDGEEIEIAVFVHVRGDEARHEAVAGGTVGGRHGREGAGAVVVVQQDGNDVADRVDAESGGVADGQIGRAVVVEVARHDGLRRDEAVDRGQRRERAAAASEPDGDAAPELIGGGEILGAVVVEIRDRDREWPRATGEDGRRRIGNRRDERRANEKGAESDH